MKTKAWAASTGGAIAGMALFGGQAAADPPQASPSNGVIAAIQDGTLILEARARFESADQTGIADADAFTLRTRLGWETAAWHGVKGLIEFEDVRQLGDGDYNDGVPPIEPFATIADPDVTEINRAQLSWVVNPQLTLTGGRQRINLDDQRFVGGVAWRQDEQTFDAVRADVTFDGFRATYAYIDHVNRVFAEELDWDGPAHLLNASYTVSPAFKMTGFSYVLDFEEPAAAIAQSSSTTGLRASGQTTVEGIRLDYVASYANQDDYGDNPASFNLDYVGLELTATHGPFSGRIAYEELEGDGARGFSTPLATLHAFQGWADVFLTTPTDGLQDFNVTGTLRPTFSAPHLSNVALTLRWHDFEAERTSADLGEEVDFQASATLAPRVTALFKIADYDGEGAPADTTRTWVGLEFRL